MTSRPTIAAFFINARGKARIDRKLVPPNTDYGRDRMGADGSSRPRLTARHSRDDIVRADNGRFIGLATDY